MKTYLITIESFIPEINIENKIRSFQLWAKPMQNVWLIKTTSDVNSVYKYLTANSYFTGKILIVHVNNDWISKNLPNDVVAWMRGGL